MRFGCLSIEEPVGLGHSFRTWLVLAAEQVHGGYAITVSDRHAFSHPCRDRVWLSQAVIRHDAGFPVTRVVKLGKGH